MSKVFLRYFLSIFAMALMILVIQYGVLFVQYDVSQKQWMKNAYNDFVTSVESTIRNGSFADYGMNGLLRTVSQINDDRVSGFIVRSADGSEILTFGKTGTGKTLTSFFPPQNQKGQGDGNVTRKIGNATRIDMEITTDYFNRVTSVAVKNVTPNVSKVDT